MKIKAIVLSVAIPAGAMFASEAWKLPSGESPLKAGPGADLVTAHCIICHSTDYISTQPRLSRAAWTATVQKMREKYGAPLPTNQVEQVVEYLVGAYGKK